MLLLALQWAALLAMTASLATRTWYEQGWLGWSLLVVAALLWAPELRQGTRRWWFFYVAGITVYTVLRSGADDFAFPVQTDYVINIDRMLFFDIEPVVWLQSKLFSPTDIDAIDWLATQIHWSFFVAPHALAVACYIWRRHLFASYVMLLLGVMYTGLLFFYLLPTTPPWLAAQNGSLDGVYRVMDFVGRSADVETYRTLYAALGEPNSVAAMPSIHMAVTFALYLWARHNLPRVAPLFLVYSALMALSLLHLAEHYATDLLVGMLCAFAVNYVVRRATARHATTALAQPAA